MGSDILPSLIIIVICIILSAYFSATETAFSSLNKTKIKTMAEKGQKRAKLVCNLVDEYDKLISTILIGNNIVNILLSSIGTVLFVKIYGNIGATISTVVVTIVVLIFGEITPKSIAKDFPEKFAVFSAPLINFFIIIFTPLNFIFTQWKKFISKFFRIKKDIGMSQEELLMFVEEVQQDGSIDENEEQLLKNIIEFSDISAEDILTHRVDVEAVPIDISKDELNGSFMKLDITLSLAKAVINGTCNVDGVKVYLESNPSVCTYVENGKYEITLPEMEANMKKSKEEREKNKK